MNNRTAGGRALPAALHKPLVFLLAMLLLGALTACSGDDIRSVDPADVEISLSTDPEPAVSAKSVTVTAKVSGIELAGWSRAAYEIRMDGKMNMVNAERLPSGEFAATVTFPQAGTYDLYVHVYQGELHVTKAKQLKVS